MGITVIVGADRLPALEPSLSGLELRTASSVDEAVDLATAETAQCLVYAGDGANDRAAIRVLQAGTGYLPIVYIGRGDGYGDFRQAMALGIDDYLSDRASPQELADAITAQQIKHRQRLSTDPAAIQPAATATAQSLDLQTLLEQLSHRAWVGFLTLDIRNYSALQHRYGHVLSHLAIQAALARLKRWRQYAVDLPAAVEAVTCVGSSRLLVVLSNDSPISTADYEAFGSTLVQRLEQPLIVNNHTLFLNVDADYLCITDQGTADRALSAWQHRLFQPTISGRPSLAKRLKQAMAHNELKLYYQPQIELETGHIIGAEALLRWAVPGETPISPAEFVLAAEENGLMLELGEWVLQEAMEQLRRWQNTQLSGVSLALNLSEYQVRHPGFMDRLAAIVRESGMSPVMMDLELTESLVMEDVETSQKLLHRLQEEGFSTAIDDFGTGHSSLGQLQRLPINILKLDQCFVRELHNNQRNQVVVKAIMDMAHGLNIVTVAEGVETAQELLVLKELACRAMQGYLFSPALSAADFENLLQRQQANGYQLLPRTKLTQAATAGSPG